ncbi:MAG: hypothetical protein NT076_05320 [Candidatus Pacearchaeota archaeon]|nr:hypothetical protein [Candidatus Pacearchaeota archaeon]
MPPIIQGFIELGIGAEIIYSFVIIICSLMIYFGTKEIYELSSYKGIKYFRRAFLFFAIAYFFRSFIKFILLGFSSWDIPPHIPGAIFEGLTIFIFLYFSSMAIFYLLYGVMWRKWNGDKTKIIIFHLLAIIISLASILFVNKLVHIMLNAFLLLFVISIVYIAHRNRQNSSKHNNFYIVYILLLIFWIFNILDILIPRFFQGIQLFGYLVSSGIFLTILYRVIKKSGK